MYFNKFQKSVKNTPNTPNTCVGCVWFYANLCQSSFEMQFKDFILKCFFGTHTKRQYVKIQQTTSHD